MLLENEPEIVLNIDANITLPKPKEDPASQSTDDQGKKKAHRCGPKCGHPKRRPRRVPKDVPGTCCASRANGSELESLSINLLAYSLSFLKLRDRAAALQTSRYLAYSAWSDLMPQRRRRLVKKTPSEGDEKKEETKQDSEETKVTKSESQPPVDSQIEKEETKQDSEETKVAKSESQPPVASQIEKEDREDTRVTKSESQTPVTSQIEKEETKQDPENTKVTKSESQPPAASQIEEGQKKETVEAEKSTGKEEAQNEKKKPRATGLGIGDPETLLARLNTRRIFKRIGHLKKSSDHSNAVPYPKNKTTEEIAIEEWKKLKKFIPPIFPSPLELLMFSPCPEPVTVLASYPRSGNTLMRTLYEKSTLRVSGSDMRGGLTKHDVVGESVVCSNKTQFVKTHFPERRAGGPFPVSRAVLLVRNPYDAIESYFNLAMTGTHTTSLTEEEREKYQQVWEEMVLKEIEVWKEFHDYWINQNIPILLVKYEDLTRHTEEVMAKVLKFVLEVDDMTFFNWRLRKTIGKERIEELGSYKPRSGGIGKSLKKYSPELLVKMNAGIYSTMKYLGYEEMLIPNPEEWKVDPMENFGYENLYGDDTVMCNAGKLVRGPERQTDWSKVKKGKDANGQCLCSYCKNKGK